MELKATSEKLIAQYIPSQNLIVLNERINNFTLSQLKQLAPNDWLKNSKINYIKTKHKSLYNLIFGAMIHEVFHIYDFKGIPHLEYMTTRKHCIQAAAIKEVSFEPECKAIDHIQKSISDSPEFLQLSGFSKRGFFVSENKSLNTQETRSADVYEYESPDEAFAVNMEFFLLDPEYKCRRPLLYSYFSDHFNDFIFAVDKVN